MSSTDPSVSDARREPEAAAVRAELERVVTSGCFQLAGRAKDFLTYVVEETLAGRADRLKGYTIGVEVFGRAAAEFDAQNDPLVRVEAGRLRRRLVEYYASEGLGNRMRIGLPRGGYAAEFTFTPAAQPEAFLPETSPLAVPVRSRRSRRRGAALIVAGVGLAVIALFWFVRVEWPDGRLGPDRATAVDDAATSLPGRATLRGPKLLVVPFANLNGAGELDYFAYGISDEIVLSLMDFDVLVVMAARDHGSDGGREDLTKSSADGSVAYVLTGSVRSSADRVRITARLVAAETGVQLWSQAFDETLDVKTLVAIQEKIARSVASATARPFGPIFSQEAAKAARKPAERLDTYDCVLRYRYYFHTLDAKEHRQTTACFERAVLQEPNLADAWAGVSLLYLDEYLYGYDAQTRGPDALTRAHEAALKACDIEGENRLGILALARVRFALGDVDGFERASERLLALSPNNPDDLIVIAGLRGIAGDWDRALPLVEQAAALIGRDRSSLIAMVTALRALQIGDYQDALARALEMDAPNWYMSQMILAAAAALAGRDDIAQRAVARLGMLNTAAAGDARALLEKWNPNEVLLAHVLEGLNAAGIHSPH
jgi:adenylate cyclase